MKSSIVGKVLDNYRILQSIGRGGMGFVFKALNIKLNKIVAIKMIAPALAMNENFMRRFEAEAKSLAKLENPNIIRIYDLRADSEYCYIVMEYVEGITLGRLIKEKGPIPWPHALKLFRQMLNAIEHAHKEGIIHRDIKPNNVLITRKGIVKITDFGLAKNQAEFGITQSATTGGTLFYMSPEQVRGLVYTDERSDVYALGFTLYEMLAGKTPFATDHTDFDIREAIIRKKFPPPHQLNKKIPAKLGRIVDKAIEKKPDDRYQKITDFISVIEDFGNKEQARQKKIHTAKAKVKGIETTDTEVAKPSDSPEPQKVVPPDEEKPEKPVQKPNRKKMYLVAASLITLIFLTYFALSNLINTETIDKPKDAQLSVTTIPNKAMVFINGDSIGQSPLSKIPIAEGKAEIHVSKPDFFSLDTTLALKQDKPLQLDVELEPMALVSLNFEPSDAVVEIDGKTIIREGWTMVPLSVGDHELKFNHPEYDTTKIQLYAQQGQNEVVDITLKKKEESIVQEIIPFKISSNPADASVFLNDKYVGNTPIEIKNLEERTYNVRMTKDGFEEYQKMIELSKANPIFLNERLSPLLGSIDVSTNPPGARIFIDGNELEGITTPTTINELPIGSKKIIIRKKGFADYSTNLEIKPKEITKITGELQMLMGAISVHAIPWGTIFVNEEKIEEATNVKQKLSLAVGEHNVKVSHPTLGTYEKIVRVENNKLTDVEVNFNKTHTVMIKALDADGDFIWADIFIDGQKTGDQTPKEMNLRTGTYTISVSRNGYVLADGPQKVIIDDSMNSPLNFVLKKTNE